jgi:hypothetical protein
MEGTASWSAALVGKEFHVPVEFFQETMSTGHARTSRTEMNGLNLNAYMLSVQTLTTIL